jgi:hypothetical protein
MIHRVPLQQADPDWGAFSLVHDTSGFAQNLGRTGPGASPAHDIRREDRPG